MSVLFSTEEPTAKDRAPIRLTDLGLVSLGQEFDMAEVDCQLLLAADLPLNSELETQKSAGNL